MAYPEYESFEHGLELQTRKMLDRYFRATFLSPGETVDGMLLKQLSCSWESEILKSPSNNELLAMVGDLGDCTVKVLKDKLVFAKVDCPLYVQNVGFLKDSSLANQNKFGFVGWIEVYLTEEQDERLKHYKPD